MNLQERIQLLVKLGQYLRQDDDALRAKKQEAERQNGWFIQPFIDRAIDNIAIEFLQLDKLENFAASYRVPAEQDSQQNIGLVMAGNIPLVGFHDWLCIFLSGHRAMVKLSSKDEVIFGHLLSVLDSWNPEVRQQTIVAPMLKGADAYIATGSNNSARYFEYYFGKYPHIIRKNRSSVAVLDGSETAEQLAALADDVYLYFGLGCRNVTKLYLPPNYEFPALLRAFDKWNELADHNKYRNNYDYQLAMLMLNRQYYMTNGSLLLVENPSIFSAISQLHYEYYDGDSEKISRSLQNNPDVQCVIGKGSIAFGQSQYPRLADFADGVDTMDFLLRLGKGERHSARRTQTG